MWWKQILNTLTSTYVAEIISLLGSRLKQRIYLRLYTLSTPRIMRQISLHADITDVQSILRTGGSSCHLSDVPRSSLLQVHLSTSSQLLSREVLVLLWMAFPTGLNSKRESKKLYTLTPWHDLCMHIMTQKLSGFGVQCAMHVT